MPAIYTRGTTAFSIRPRNYPDYVARHRGGLMFIDRDSTLTSQQDKEDASFILVDGLADPNLTSLMARNEEFNGFYVRHRDSRLRVERRPEGGDDLFNNDATWIFDPFFNSFRAVNYPEYYVRHRLGELWADKNPEPDASVPQEPFRSDSQWILDGALAPLHY